MDSAPPPLDLARAAGHVVTVPKGASVFGVGQTPDHLLLVTRGVVRVQQVTEGGREIVLYRVHAGESCVLTTACLIGEEPYSAEGIAETEAEAIAVPKAAFDRLIASSAAFRKFVFASYSQRMADLFLTIEEIAFHRIDMRLADKLLELSDGSGVQATHQQLAAELGTAREVVSRQLLEFQRRGWIEQGRGRIVLLSPDRLRAFVSTNR
ncbi:Crp/Fnr family transcriptional regulator [Loktanella sp. IMCC34160]|uniref:Crp/Fnr family transcriptional regulator n=1 Tax=Loktanella sp. IMCC34160 TaxID=2510646 RepID=UPI00101D5CCA|nr:Crp/Fnr family transcriptional regulator [Loktanella sp. IMCC34160]RYG93240.1 Crp/Fnr family transcriptional regulator [Loktanella sp. IMCC34160]